MRTSFILLAIVVLLIPVAALAQQGSGGPNGNQNPECTQDGDCDGGNQGNQNGQGGQNGPGDQTCTGDQNGPANQDCVGNRDGRGGRGRGQARGQGQGRGGSECRAAVLEYRDALPMQNLDIDEEQGLAFAREEEKLARDVYLTLYLDWGLPIFSKIARAEQTHMEALGWMIDRYAQEDPIEDDAIGVFSDSELQHLYSDLVLRGRQSVEDALLVGATIEDLDIFDHESLLEATDNADYSMVLYNLIKGSRNHMRAFIFQLDLYDVAYEAEFLSPEALAEILASPRERGVVYDENGEALDLCGDGQS